MLGALLLFADFISVTEKKDTEWLKNMAITIATNTGQVGIPFLVTHEFWTTVYLKYITRE